jgi:hypothetical protein
MVRRLVIRRSGLGRVPSIKLEHRGLESRDEQGRTGGLAASHEFRPGEPLPQRTLDIPYAQRIISFGMTTNQERLISRLASEREIPRQHQGRLNAVLTSQRILSTAEASRCIEWLLALPNREDGLGKVEELVPGVYETAEGIFVVRPTRDKERLYAKKLVPLNTALRDTAQGG